MAGAGREAKPKGMVAGPAAGEQEKKKKYTVADLEIGTSYRGQLVKFISSGVFVRLRGFKPDGFCHISMLSDKRVEDVQTDRWCEGSAPKLGQWVRARVIDIDEKRGRFTLSMQSAAMREHEIEAVRKYRGETVAQGSDAPAAVSSASPKSSAGVDGSKRKRSAEKQKRRNERRLAKKKQQQLAKGPAGVGCPSKLEP